MPKMTQEISDKAAGIGEEFARGVTAVRSNADLTPDARTRQLAAVYHRAKRQMDGLQQSWRDSAVATDRVVTKDLFGSMLAVGADAISQRDAADRADQIGSPEEAARLMQQAERTGDGVLAKAVAARSYDMAQVMPEFGGGAGWAQVVDGYASTRPEVAGKIEQLHAARATEADEGMEAAFAFAVSRPSELSRVPDYAILQMADEQTASA